MSGLAFASVPPITDGATLPRLPTISSPWSEVCRKAAALWLRPAPARAPSPIGAPPIIGAPPMAAGAGASLLSAAGVVVSVTGAVTGEASRDWIVSSGTPPPAAWPMPPPDAALPGAAAPETSPAACAEAAAAGAWGGAVAPPACSAPVAALTPPIAGIARAIIIGAIVDTGTDVAAVYALAAAAEALAAAVAAVVGTAKLAAKWGVEVATAGAADVAKLVPTWGADVTETGAPIAVTCAASAASVPCTSAMAPVAIVTAWLAAAIAAAIPHGKMMLGPIAAIVAKNSSMVATSCAPPCCTLAATTDRLVPNALAWLATWVPLATAALVFAPAADAALPCHAPSRPAMVCVPDCPPASNACKMPPNICVGPRLSNSPGPNIPSASVTGWIICVNRPASMPGIPLFAPPAGGAPLGLAASAGGAACGDGGSPKRARTSRTG